jgi:hypothetical protein
MLVKVLKPDKVLLGTEIDSVVLPKSRIGYKSIDQLSSEELKVKVDACEADLLRFKSASEYPPAACRLVKCIDCSEHCDESKWSKCGINLNSYSNRVNDGLGVFIVPKFRVDAGLKTDFFINLLLDDDIDLLVKNEYLVLLDYCRRVYSSINYYLALDVVEWVNNYPVNCDKLIGFLKDNLDTFKSFLKRSLYVSFESDANRVFDRKLEGFGHGQDYTNHDGLFDPVPIKSVMKSYKPYFDNVNDIKTVDLLE